ncbi:MAG: hypothetical protein AAF351_06715 [Pseudomonadota bacterium]
MTYTIRVLVALMMTATATLAFADDYDFELNVSFDNTTLDFSQTITTDDGVIFNTNDSDTDVLSVSGTWYFSGLSDTYGPRSRAAFANRASSVSLGYTELEQEFRAVLENSIPGSSIPSFAGVNRQDDEIYAGEFRYVLPTSGWFVTGGFQTSSLLDENRWEVGVGKYLFTNTALSLVAGKVETDDGIPQSNAEVRLEHLGQLSEDWLYGVDVSFRRDDYKGGFVTDRWRAALSLFPTKDFEFGVAAEDYDSNFPSGTDQSYEGFATWYVTDKVGLSASYKIDDLNWFGNVSLGGVPAVRDTEQDTVGVTATIRFD